MKKSNKFILGLFLGIFLLQLIILVPQVLADSESIKLAIPIPMPGEGEYTSVSGLAQYIKIIYEFGVMAAAILAAVMIFFGGFSWIQAAGNPSRIQKAKESIVSAIIGLILALGSYLLLQIVNPNLVSFQNIGPTSIKTEQAGACIGEPLVTPIPNGTPVKGKEAECGKEHEDANHNECGGRYCVGYPPELMGQKVLCANPGVPPIGYQCMSANEIINSCAQESKNCDSRIRPNPFNYNNNVGNKRFIECRIDTRGLNDCFALFYQCGDEIKNCEDYSDKVMVSGWSVGLHWITFGIYSTLPTDEYIRLCTSNLCNIGTGCRYNVDTTKCESK